MEIQVQALLHVGNINQLILKMDSYSETLERTKGSIAEFVNPKYTDSSKTSFKSATRLECMMQDYPLALPSSAKVGFTVINQVELLKKNILTSFSPDHISSSTSLCIKIGQTLCLTEFNHKMKKMNQSLARETLNCVLFQS